MNGITIAYDAKRAFANRRGLGNYSRDVIRLMQTYAPQNDYVLCGIPSALCDTSHVRLCSPRGLWRLFPSLWRSGGCLHQLRDVTLYHGLSGELPYGIHRTSIRTAVTVHDTIFMRYPHLYSPTYRWLFACKVRYACTHADLIIAISEQTKQDLIHYFHADAQKIRVVYQGCSNLYRKPVTDAQVAQVRSQYNLPERYMLYVGALEERKNLHRLIEAVVTAKIEVPLVLVGAMSAYGEQLCRLAEKAGVHMQICSDVPQADLPAFYKGAELFVYPSLYEGFGIPVLEAMCIGTPVVTSTGSCFAETGGDAALYADPLQPEQIGAQLVRVLSDADLRNRMITKGQAQAERFTDEKVASSLIQIYHELCEF